MGAVRSVTMTVAWLAATAAAVGVSWLGVRTVVPEAVVTPPQIAVPTGSVATGTPPPLPTATPLITSIVVPPPKKTTTTTTVRPTTSTSPPSASDVHSYSLPGGQVVLAITPTQATLVSATPANGFSVQEWQETGWLRVDFSSSTGTSTLYATWNGTPPTVQTFQS